MCFSTSNLNSCLGVVAVAIAFGASLATAEENRTGTIALETAVDRLIFEQSSGRLVSLRSKVAPDVDLVATASDHPSFVLDYLDADRKYRRFESHDAKKVTVHCADSGQEQTLTAIFSNLGGLDLDVTLTARASKQKRLSRWSIAVRNGTGLRIANVQFPFVVVPLDAKGSLLLPEHCGRLCTGASLDQQPQDDPVQWRDTYSHYPGFMFAQFLAWYTERGGVYVACEDTEGNVKVIKAVKHAPGMRLGIAHVGDWPTQGERKLEYDVVLGSFAGDWHNAADLYRNWSLRQKWATPLNKRTDVPKWLLDSPVYLTVRPQGYMDDESMRIEQFLPYEKCIPLLEDIARRVESPLAVVLMAWERGGPWVYPDCFPPIGGDESIAHFCAMARQRGWNVGSFCNGTRWVTGRKDGYDGKKYFEEHHGEQTVCRRQDGSPDVEDWGWRIGYRSCNGPAGHAADRCRFCQTVDWLGHGVDPIFRSELQCFDVALLCRQSRAPQPRPASGWPPRWPT